MKNLFICIILLFLLSSCTTFSAKTMESQVVTEDGNKLVIMKINDSMLAVARVDGEEAGNALVKIAEQFKELFLGIKYNE